MTSLAELELMACALFAPVDMDELLHGRPGATYHGLLGTVTIEPYASPWPSDGIMTRQRRRAAERAARKAARHP